MAIWTQALACLVCLVYASFFEWVAHRYFMHQPRFPLRDAFRGHMEHHQIYRHDHRFAAHPEDHPGGIVMRWYAFPAMILGHLPFFFLFQWATGLEIVWGAVAGCSLYFAGYEFTHYLMHVPHGHFFERARWFRFIREHHRLHHQYMRCNFNVLVPLADACLGTLRTKD